LLGLIKFFIEICVNMKAEKANIVKPNGATQTPKVAVNPFTKLMDDKERIADAINNDQSLSSLKGIKFVRPL
jgi:TolB-like protein